MTKSRTVGPVRLRPQITKGAKTGKWFVDVPASLTGNGKRKRKLFDNYRQANEAAKALARLVDPITGTILSGSANSGLTLMEAVRDWAKDEELRVLTLKKRAKTLETDLYRMKAVLLHFGNVTLTSITEKDLTEYQAARLRLGRKPITVNGELKVLQLVFRWAVKNKYLSRSPTCERVPERPVQSIIPTPEEVVRIIEALPDYLQPLIQFLAETGCRKGEAINLTWDCVDEVSGFVEIRSREGWTPKTQASERRIPISDGLLGTLRTLPKAGQYVFPGDGPDQPIGEFRKTWRRAVMIAKLMRRGSQVYIPVKSLRKAHATWQAERGVTESVLQGLLGHARGSKITRQFYVQVTDEAKRAAVIQLPASNR